MATNVVSRSVIVDEVLGNENYANWSACMKSYMLALDLWDIVEATREPPNAEDKAWRMKNAAALHAIQISCGPNMLSKIRDKSSAKIAWDSLAKMHETQSPTVHPDVAGMDNSEYRHFPDLYKAVEKGDWDAVLKLCPQDINTKISHTGVTVLHVASYAGHVKIVKKLVQKLKEEDLEMQDASGFTALAAAALNGITKIAKCLIRKNKKLTSIANFQGEIPLVVACSGGHKEMTRYLYSVTPPELLENDTHGSLLLDYAIAGKILDVALDLLRCCSHLATKSHEGTIPIVTLSRMYSVFPSGSRLAFWQQWIYSRIHIQLPDVRIYIPQKDESEWEEIIVKVSGRLRGVLSHFLNFLGIEQILNKKLIHVQALELLQLMCKEISTSDITRLNTGAVHTAFFEAIKHGIVEFVTEMIKANPDLMYTVDMNSRGIFLSAVEYRQEKIFSLLYGLDSRKYRFISHVDKFKNNMLHMAGVLTPSSQLDRISGAALQMQRELQWYKEVENMVNPMYKESVNDDGETPRQVFTRNHRNLLKEGEEWLQRTASSCSVVGTLIITIMFAVAFTVPGGNHSDTGLPIYLHEKSFKVFIISDAISLSASCTSVLMFLRILTSRYGEEDFLISLPTRLIIGLSTLFFSIAAMMVSFCAALFLMLDGHLWIIIPMFLLASIPVTLFVFLQYPLLVEIFKSTYGSGIFDRKVKCWL